MICRGIVHNPHNFDHHFDYFNDYSDTKHWVRNNPRIPFWMKWYLQVKLDRGWKRWLIKDRKRTLEIRQEAISTYEEYKEIVRKFTTGKDTNAD